MSSMSLKFSPWGSSQLPITPPVTPLPRDALGVINESFLPFHKKKDAQLQHQRVIPSSQVLFPCIRHCWGHTASAVSSSGLSLREGHGGAGGSPEQGNGAGAAQPGENEAQEWPYRSLNSLTGGCNLQTALRCARRGLGRTLEEISS